MSWKPVSKQNIFYTNSGVHPHICPSCRESRTCANKFCHPKDRPLCEVCWVVVANAPVPDVPCGKKFSMNSRMCKGPAYA